MIVKSVIQAKFAFLHIVINVKPKYMKRVRDFRFPGVGTFEVHFRNMKIISKLKMHGWA